MAMITPEAERQQKYADESNIPSGMYLTRLSRVQEIGPSAKFPNGNNRLVFEFEVADGEYRGKKAAMFVGKSLYKDPKTGKEANLVKLVRSMGVIKPETGFDPDTLLGKHFNAMCENQDGRAWVRAVTPAAAPAAVTAPVAGPKPPTPPPAPTHPQKLPEPADTTRWQWHDGADWHNGTAVEFRTWMGEAKKRADEVYAAPAGTQDSKLASDHGFEIIPF